MNSSEKIQMSIESESSEDYSPPHRIKDYHIERDNFELKLFHKIHLKDLVAKAISENIIQDINIKDLNLDTSQRQTENSELSKRDGNFNVGAGQICVEGPFFLNYLLEVVQFDNTNKIKNSIHDKENSQSEENQAETINFVFRLSLNLILKESALK